MSVHVSSLPSVTPLEHFNLWADTYDNTAKKNNWHSPEILFGAQKPFLNPTDKILDLGCGTGLVSKLYKDTGISVWGLDGSKSMLEICARKKLNKDLQILDLSRKNIKLPYKNKFFQQTISSGSIYFIESLEPVIKEVARVMSPGGSFVFDIQETYMQPVIYKRFFSR